MGLENSNNNWEVHTKLSAIEKVASPAIEKKDSENLANIEGKKVPPKPENDVFKSKGIPKLEFENEAAKFSSAQETGKSSLDPFGKINTGFSPVKQEDVAGVLRSLKIMEDERNDKEDVFSSDEGSTVYGRGEGNHTDFLAEDNQATVEKLDEKDKIKRAVENT